MLDYFGLTLAQAAEAPPAGEADAPPVVKQTEVTAPTGETAPAPGTTTTPTGTPSGGGGPGGGSFPFLLIIAIFAVFWFVLMGGQRKEKKKRAELLSSLAKGAKVQTIGGEIGTVMEVRENEVVLKVDENTNTRIRYAKSAIQTVLQEKED